MPNDQWLDPLSETIRQRFVALMEAHGLTRDEAGTAIERGRSWMSEFCRGERGTDDLRLVLSMARLFKVPVGYILGLENKKVDPRVMAMVALFEDLTPFSQDTVLQLAQRLHQKEQPDDK